MDDNRMLEDLSGALKKTAPNNVNAVLSRCEAQSAPPAKRKPYRALLAACLALALLCTGLLYRQTNAVATVVSLDVNPSIELSVSRSERVLACTALNADAQAVLAGMNGGADLEGVKLDVAVNAIVGSLLRCGYLDELSSAIMISVEDSSAERAARLQRELTSAVDLALSRSAAQADVLTQTLTQDAGLAQKAHSRGVSTGKAALVERVLKENAALSFDALCALSVAELQQLLSCGAPGMPIGCAAAAEAAEKYAGTLALSSVTSDVDPELDETPAHYEVELDTLWGEFTYRIDAFTGAVLSGQANIIPAAQPDARTDIGLEAARAAALRRAELSAAAFTEAERDDDDAEYDFTFTDGTWEYECTISALDGSVLDFEREPLEHDDDDDDDDHDDDHDDDRDDEDEMIAVPSAVDIGAEAARAAALRHAGLSAQQVTQLEVEADSDDGRRVYEVEFRCGEKEYEYEIAADGTVLAHNWEYDD